MYFFFSFHTAVALLCKLFIYYKLYSTLLSYILRSTLIKSKDYSITTVYQSIWFNLREHLSKSAKLGTNLESFMRQCFSHLHQFTHHFSAPLAFAVKNDTIGYLRFSQLAQFFSDWVTFFPNSAHSFLIFFLIGIFSVIAIQLWKGSLKVKQLDFVLMIFSLDHDQFLIDSVAEVVISNWLWQPDPGVWVCEVAIGHIKEEDEQVKLILFVAFLDSSHYSKYFSVWSVLASVWWAVSVGHGGNF